MATCSQILGRDVESVLEVWWLHILIYKLFPVNPLLAFCRVELATSNEVIVASNVTLTTSTASDFVERTEGKKYINPFPLYWKALA